MELFRRLAGNIFFKIILGFVALSFVLFGVSGFILGSPNSWVVKIGDTKIGSNTFNSALRADREIVLKNNHSNEAAQYVESEAFKSDVLGRMVNKIMIEKLSQDFGISASKKIILSAIAKDANFKNESGVFDHKKFEDFLAKNGFNEKRYVDEISSEVTSVMILQTLALSAPVSDYEIAQKESFKQEKRVADVVTISEKNLNNSEKPSKDEIEKFYAENKQGYVAPEMRKVSYIHFSKNDFSNEFVISDKELQAEYEKNKSQMMQPESRNFYHMLFTKEADAKKFADEVKKADKSHVRDVFVKLAKAQNKDQKTITLNQMTQKDLLPQLTATAFKLTQNEVSEPTESPLGFHVFLLLDVKKSQPLSFDQAKASLKQSLTADRDDKIMQKKISAIDDLLLTSNSISEVAKKFNLKTGTSEFFDANGNDVKGKAIAENSKLEGFSKNSFALREGQTSKIFYAKNSAGFYAIKVEKLTATHERKLSEVEGQIIADLQKTKKVKGLRELANKVAKEIAQNPENAAQIAAKYHANFEKNREFARQIFVTIQGRQMAYQTKFLEELFDLELNHATSAQNIQSEKDFSIAILRAIKTPSNSESLAIAKRATASEELRNEIMSDYNSYLLKRYPVKINEKFFAKKAEK